MLTAVSTVALRFTEEALKARFGYLWCTITLLLWYCYMLLDARAEKTLPLLLAALKHGLYTFF